MNEIEKYKYTKDFIDKMANGINPLTDEEVADDTLINNVRISRCLFYVSGLLDEIISNGGISKKSSSGKAPFTITPEQKLLVKLSEEPVGIQAFSKLVSEATDDNMKALSCTKITSWLLENGYLKEELVNSKRRKVATEKGEAMGIFTIDSVSMNGIPYKKNIYNYKAQRFILDNIESIVE